MGQEPDLLVVVFGVELEYLLQRDAASMESQPGAIPSVIDQLIAYVETKGLTDIGICGFFCSSITCTTS